MSQCQVFEFGKVTGICDGVCQPRCLSPGFTPLDHDLPFGRLMAPSRAFRAWKRLVRSVSLCLPILTTQRSCDYVAKLVDGWSLVIWVEDNVSGPKQTFDSAYGGS